jgi:hypothetical protein
VRDANVLDDYEEGNWVPSLGGNATYNSTPTGTYTKVGRLVTVRGLIDVNVLGTGSTGTITGLPFATAAFASLARWGSIKARPVRLRVRRCLRRQSGTSVTVTAVAAGGATGVGNPAVFFRE